MATTTNYGWTTPDDTGLVKDGASAIRSLGTAIDTTVKSNADAAINKTLIDAKGDLIVGSAADTAARLAVGTDGQILTADSASAGGVKWNNASAGAYTVLASGSIASAGSTISSISGSYTDLKLYIYNWVASSSGQAAIRFNGVTTSTYYEKFFTYTDTAMPAAADSTWWRVSSAAGTGDLSSIEIQIPRYADTSYYKTISVIGFGMPANSARLGWGFSINKTAISSISILPSAGTVTSGTYALIGVK